METTEKLKYRNEHIIGTRIESERVVITSKGPQVANVGDWYVVFQDGDATLYTEENFHTLFEVIE